MALKAVLDTLDGISADIAKEYTKGDDGKYRLSVDGMVDKAKLDEFRNNNIRLTQEMEKYKDIDPAKYRQFAEEKRALEEKALLAEGKIEEVVTQRVTAMRTEFETNNAKLKRDLDSSNQQLGILLIDNAVRDAATKEGVVASAVDDVLLRGKTTFQVKDGVAVAMDKDGKVVYGKDGTTSLTVTEWVSGLKKTAPHLFPSSNGGGAGGGSGKGGRPNMDNLSPSQKIAEGLRQRHG